MPVRHLYLLVLLLTGLAMPAYAKSDNMQKSLGAFGNWRAYSFDDHDQPVCYMVLSSNPPAGKIKRGPRRLTITHRPSEGSKDVVSYTPGYNMKPETSMTIRIGTKTFDLFTAKDTAWARDPGTDRALAAAIRSAKGMTASGMPAQKGAKPVADTLELSGGDKAYQAIGKACGYTEEKEQKQAITAKKKVKKPAVKH